MGTGFRWTVTFQSELGNLPLLEATPVRHEVQVVETLGGVPTPLGGTFTLSFGGVSTTPLSYDVDAAVMEEALQGLSTIGSVDVSRTGPHGNGKYKWTIKFRSNLGDVQYLDFDDTQLTGSNPQVLVCGPGTQCAVGDDDALPGTMSCPDGSRPPCVLEDQAGLPSYTGSFTPSQVGTYSVAVRQLIRGGLYGEFYDNQWLDGTATTQISAQIDFDWGDGLVVPLPYSRDYVSARWTGKLLGPHTDAGEEDFTIYVQTGDGVRVWIDHGLEGGVPNIDRWDGALSSNEETYTVVRLRSGQYHDIRVEYRHERGDASLRMFWSSFSIPKTIVPSSNLYSATHISGSPFSTETIPGAADYPNTRAFGPGLDLPDANEIQRAGVMHTFTIEARDFENNVRHEDFETFDGRDLFDVTMIGTNSGTSVNVDVTHVSGGTYRCEYYARYSDLYELSIKMGGTDIMCGQGMPGCSPFSVFVEPGYTTYDTTHATGLGLMDAIAGSPAHFEIQAQDAHGNDNTDGGEADRFNITLVHQSSGKTYVFSD